MRKIKTREYYPTKTGAKFHNSSAHYKGIMGPVGSGKSVCCVMELFMKACQQEPQDDGVRRSRWVVVRNTYKQLITTTIKTFQEWIPDKICHLNMSHSPIDGVLRIPLEDGTSVEADFWFMALDRPDSVSDLKSLEITGAWINEARYVNEVFASTLIERCRYPQNATWMGLLLDTNPPNNSHWYYKYAELKKPEGWEFFRQPPAVIRDINNKPYVNVGGDRARGIDPAENLNHLVGGPEYYKKQLNIKKPMEIAVDLEGNYGFLHDGKPVWSMYNDQIHFSKEPLSIYRGLPILMGTDNGRSPATVIGQLTPFGQLRILRILIAENMGHTNFIKQVVKPVLDSEFQGMTRHNYCDPACDQKSQTDEVTIKDVWNKNGIHSEIAPCSNRIQPRLDSVENRLMGNCDDGTTNRAPAILIDPSCEFLREAFLGGYHFRLVQQIGNADQYKEEPNKNKYSHICDALQYLCISHDADYLVVKDDYEGANIPKEIITNTEVVW